MQQNAQYDDIESPVKNKDAFAWSDVLQNYADFENQDKPVNKRLKILRSWLIFLTCCFIFEELALELPGYANMNKASKTSLGMIALLTVVNICLIVYSFKVNIKAVYFISLTMQVAFICCNLKTSHHASTPENYIVVRNACSARLILMAL